MMLKVKIYKSINNNIVSAYDNSGNEVVVIGKGIGYKAVEGAEIPKDKITKVFVMDSHDNIVKLKDLLGKLQKEYIEITDEILIFARDHLGKKLNESAYFTLADHISFAVSRIQEKMPFQNILLTEIKSFYPKEFEVGLYAVKLIKEKIGVDMPECEAVSIALHILNAAYYTSVSEAFKGTQLLGWVMECVAKHIKQEIDTNSHYGERFIIHVKYMVQRIIHKDVILGVDDGIYKLMEGQYGESIKICEKVADDIKEEYKYELSKYEIACMAMHITRLKYKAKII